MTIKTPGSATPEIFDFPVRTQTVTPKIVAAWLDHWYTLILNHTTPKDCKIDPRIEDLQKYHPKTLLVMAELLRKFTECPLRGTKGNPAYGFDQAAATEHTNEAVYLVAYFWPFKNCVWASLTYFEYEETEDFEVMVECFTILTGDEEGGIFFAHLLQNSMSVIFCIPAPY